MASRDSMMDWMTSCLAQYSFGMTHTHNITIVEFEENRLNLALKNGVLLSSHNPVLCKMYRDAWESTLKGRHLVVKATGSFYEMISLPLVAPRKLLKIPTVKKPTAQGELQMYIDELVEGEWMRTFYDLETYGDKLMEVVTSGKAFRTGQLTGDASQLGSDINKDDSTDVNDDPDDGCDEDDVTAGATKPDIDMMVVDLDKKLCHIGEEGSDDMFAWMVPSEHPGFLHLVHPKSQEFMTTDQLRSIDNVEDARAIAMLCFSKMNSTEMLPKITSITNQGPAVTLEFDISKLQVNFTDSMDVVRSLFCPTWPAQARKWDDKTYRWPGRQLADRIIADGCHIVAVPHPLCKQSRFEFRFSFSHAEVLLTKSLVEGMVTKAEHTQARLLAYMVVKFIVKFCIKKASQQIKSYYAKTTLYWYLESEDSPDTAGSIWTHANKILHKLQGFFSTGDLPNYCIPANNMIRHVEESDCKLIIDAIQKVRDDPIGALLKIHRDIVVLGFELNETCSMGMIEVLKELGFKPKQMPHFSILNTAFQPLYDVLSQTSKDVTNVSHLREFLTGSLGTALCRLQVEPKVLSLLPLLNTLTAFQQCPVVCPKCQQEVSVVDMMFHVILSGLTSALNPRARLRDAVAELLQIASCYGFDESDHPLMPAVSRLQNYLAVPRHRAQWYRWCAVVGFVTAVQEDSGGDAVCEPDHSDGAEISCQKLTKEKDPTESKCENSDGAKTSCQKLTKGKDPTESTCENSDGAKTSCQKLTKEKDPTESECENRNKAGGDSVLHGHSNIEGLQEVSKSCDSQSPIEETTQTLTERNEATETSQELGDSKVSKSSDSHSAIKETTQKITEGNEATETLQELGDLNDKGVTDNLDGDETLELTDHLNAKVMFQRASSMDVPSLFSAVCRLEFSLYLLHVGDLVSARDIVSSMSVEALNECNAMAAMTHSDRGVCLEDVLIVRQCKRMQDLNIQFHRIVKEIHNIDMNFELFRMIAF